MSVPWQQHAIKALRVRSNRNLAEVIEIQNASALGCTEVTAISMRGNKPENLHRPGITPRWMLAET
jgi:hypothetical protein